MGNFFEIETMNRFDLKPVGIGIAAISSFAFYRWFKDEGKNGNSAFTTSEQIVDGLDLSDQIILVTGCRHGGIGFHTAKALASRGATVVLHARKQADNDEAIRLIRQEHPDAKLKSVVADLSDLEEVRQMAHKVDKMCDE